MSQSRVGGRLVARAAAVCDLVICPKPYGEGTRVPDAPRAGRGGDVQGRGRVIGWREVPLTLQPGRVGWPGTKSSRGRWRAIRRALPIAVGPAS